jgi:hypothetical protein
MPRVRGAAFFGVLRLAGARLRLEVLLLFVAIASLLAYKKNSRKDRKDRQAETGNLKPKN